MKSTKEFGMEKCANCGRELNEANKTEISGGGCNRYLVCSGCNGTYNEVELVEMIESKK
jgi:DNA-directed RNA polymerase subunit RPC12/RpoP